MEQQEKEVKTPLTKLVQSLIESGDFGNRSKCDPTDQVQNSENFLSGEFSSNNQFSSKIVSYLMEQYFYDENCYQMIKLAKFVHDDQAVHQISLFVKDIGRDEPLAAINLYETGTIEQQRWAYNIIVNEYGSQTPEKPRVQEAFDKYFDHYHIPKRWGASEKFVNAAAEIKKQKYDLIIGVLGAGTPIPGLIEMMGNNNVRYLEWHKKWKKKLPTWKNIGRVRDVVTQADKILVCENDTQYGTTLATIQPLLEKLQPKQVDVSFYIDVHQRNKMVVNALPFYNSAFDIKDLPTDRSFEHWKGFARLSERILKTTEENNDSGYIKSTDKSE